MANLKAEEALTIAVVDYCRWRKGGREMVIHIPNEGSDRASIVRRTTLCRMGLRPGASDLFFPVPIAYELEKGMGIRPGFWLELKAKDKRPTQEQMDFMNEMAALGYSVGWTDNFEDAKSMIDYYFAPRDEGLTIAPQPTTNPGILETFNPSGKSS